MSVDYISLPVDDELAEMQERGWAGVGWYFWDEIGAHCYGPYNDKTTAEQKLAGYAQSLENRQKLEDAERDKRWKFTLKSVQRCCAFPAATTYDETHTLWEAGYVMNPDDGGESGQVWLTPKGYAFLGVLLDPKIAAYLNLLLYFGEMEDESMHCNCITVHSWYGEGHCSGCPCEESQELRQTLKVLRPPGIGF